MATVERIERGAETAPPSDVAPDAPPDAAGRAVRNDPVPDASASPGDGEDTSPAEAGDGTERDRYFVEPDAGRQDFTFGAKTVSVFDDMVSRSVPFYDEMQRMTGEMVADFAQPGSRLYDLGCATGTTLALLHDVVDPSVTFVGVDTSPAMIERAREKLTPAMESRRIELVTGDATRDVVVEDASATLLLLTLQFVRPLHREALLERIHAGLRPRGCLILIEKLLFADGLINRQFIDYYYALKRRRGYSEMEIARKREALENVLIPYRFDENVAMLRAAGFSIVEEFFRWYNFAGIIAVK